MRNRRFRQRWAALGLLCMGLAACEEALPRVVQVYLHPSGTRDYLPRAVEDGPILIDMRPDRVADAGFARTAADVMNSAAAQKTTSIFTTEPVQAGSTARVVIFLGAPKGMAGRRFCTEPPTGDAVRGEKETILLATLCVDEKRRAEATVWLPSDVAAEDQDYRRAMQDLMNALFENPTVRD
ncbi:MAG: hypothetical protein QNJ84_18085 [Alphaproteobacteria bacterium]|nr:hypothetical protein [Alphaproteobacteria bacterium]